MSQTNPPSCPQSLHCCTNHFSGYITSLESVRFVPSCDEEMVVPCTLSMCSCRPSVVCRPLSLSAIATFPLLLLFFSHINQCPHFALCAFESADDVRTPTFETLNMMAFAIKSNLMSLLSGLSMVCPPVPSTRMPLRHSRCVVALESRILYQFDGRRE